MSDTAIKLCLSLVSTRQEKEIKCIQIRKAEIKLFLFSDGMIVYIKYFMVCIKTFLKIVISEFSKAICWVFILTLVLSFLKNQQCFINSSIVFCCQFYFFLFLVFPCFFLLWIFLVLLFLDSWGGSLVYWSEIFPLS